MMRRVRRAFAIAVGVLFATSTATALEYHFAGTVGMVTEGFESFEGLPWSVRVAFDPAAVAASNEGPLLCSLSRLTRCHDHDGTIERTTITVGDETTELTESGRVFIERPYNGHAWLSIQYERVTLDAPGLLGTTEIGIGVGVRDPSLEVIDSLEIPSALDIDRLDLTATEGALLLYADGLRHDFGGGLLLEIESFAIVPEPGTATLLGLGLLALGARARR